MRTDSEIQQAVLHELKWDTRVSETDVGVEVDSGVVTLTGTVASWAKRVAAEQAAHRVAGVHDVANDIQVKVPGRGSPTDTEIAHAVRHALKWSVFVPETQITSTVSDGHASLEGRVDYLTQREDAERAVRDLAGVTSVINNIEVVPPRFVSTADVRSAIADALVRRVERELERVHLDVRDGRVTLSGSVHTWAEHQAAIGAARGTPGVRSIEDHLRVE